MIGKAPLVETEHGLVPEGEGWFIVNARDARWFDNDAFGSICVFEAGARFPQFGINIHVLSPGKPNCMYHAENAQEDFFVLSGECIVLIEGEERPLKQWDFVHCPPWTEHVFVGAGTGPCVVLMVGARPDPEELRYPVVDVALKHSAGVVKETSSGDDAYAPFPRSSPTRYREGTLPSLG